MALNLYVMSKSTNRLVAVAKLSLRLSSKYLQPYSCVKSPHTFTQPQLMTCLVLRAYLKTTYRGVIEILETSETLRETLNLKRLPHYSTLKYFADRSGTLEIVDAMLAELAKQYGKPQEPVAIDSTGLETTAASSYFETRRGRKQKKYVKLSIGVLCGSLMPAGLVVGWGPSNDKADAFPLLVKTATAVHPSAVYADAGYDAEWVHYFCAEIWNTKSFIPPAVHRADGGVNGTFRSQMTPRRLKRNGYTQRWKIESFMSALKRTTGSTLQARQTTSLFREAAFRVLAYALRR
jgi:hypothetical protein